MCVGRRCARGGARLLAALGPAAPHCARRRRASGPASQLSFCGSAVDYPTAEGEWTAATVPESLRTNRVDMALEEIMSTVVYPTVKSQVRALRPARGRGRSPRDAPPPHAARIASRS